MRLDKFLKVSRLAKRRELAKEIIANGYVKINNKIAKPASEVQVDDAIEITFLKRTLLVKVRQIKQNASIDEASSMYETIKEIKNNDTEL